ncbi:MAG: hypothetical protein ACKN89_11400, partial [Cyanobium sp.]
AANTINKANVSDGSGTYYQLGTNRFYGFESITIVNPPLNLAPPTTGGISQPTINAAAIDTIIAGGIGAGRTLTATAGKDIVRYNTSFDFTYGDTIVNFQPGTDKLLFTQLDRSSPIGKALKGASSGKLLTKVTRSRNVAGSRTVFVYNSSNGELYYNPNGSRAGFGNGGGLIADFTPNVNLSNADFQFSYSGF